jgi:tetratricopeptide (TPR) repeat protein
MNPWQHNRLGAVYTLMADLIPARRVELTAMAEREVRSAAEYDHQNPLFQLNLAYYLHRAGRFEEARKYYQIVLDMDPNILEAHYNMADISRREGKIGDTLKSYLAVYTVNKDFPNINLALAGTYAQMGRTADAIPYMEAEIKKRPDFVDGIKSLITMYQQTGNFARIAELYYQLIMLNPGSKDYYPAFAAAVKTAGKSDATLASLNQLKAQNPNAQVLDELIALVR